MPPSKLPVEDNFSATFTLYFFLLLWVPPFLGAMLIAAGLLSSPCGG
jgi:hypothetical protein